MKARHKTARLSRRPESTAIWNRGFLYALAIFGGLALMGAVYAIRGGADAYDFSIMLFAGQDVWVLGLAFCLLLVLKFKPDLLPAPSARRLVVRPFTLIALGVLVFLLCYTGSFVVMERHPLSIDEFWVLFDAGVYGQGRLAGSVPPEWRNFMDAMQPVYQLETADNAFWVSTYLPVNAILHAVLAELGDMWLTAPVLAAVSLVLMYGTARQIWPDRRDAAFVAVLLLATSAQFLFTAMTPFAMTAHLAFNLLWLWLYQRNTGLSHGGALLTGFAATGLHQIAFHPLFAAPFVASLWLRRRWRLASLYTIAYAAICLFWILYVGLLAQAEQGAVDTELTDFFARVVSLFGASDAGVLMRNNLARFVAWQSPLAIILLVAAVIGVRRWRSPLPELAVGVVLMLVLAFFVMPVQGYGWGYRYLHGLLGSISLIAAYGWIVLTERNAREMRAVLVACSAFAILVLPLRAWQANALVHPYAALSRTAQNADADIVVMDPGGIWFGAHQVRNDPLLRTPPMIVLNYLDEPEIRALCARHRVAVVDYATAKRLGVKLEPRPSAGRNAEKRRLMARLGCGVALTGENS